MQRQRTIDHCGHSFDDEDYGRLAGCIENMDSVDGDDAGGDDGDAADDGKAGTSAAPGAADFARAGSNESTLVSSPSPPRGGGGDYDDDDYDDDDGTDEDDDGDGAPPPPPPPPPSSSSSMHRHHPTSPGPFLLDPMPGSGASFPPPSSSRDPSFAVTPSGASTTENAVDGGAGNTERAYGASPTSLSWEECIDNLFDDIANGMSPPGIGGPGQRNGDALVAATGPPPPGEKRSSDDHNGTPLAAVPNKNARSFSLKRRSGNGDALFSGGGGGSPVVECERERQRRRWNDDDDEDSNVDGGSKIPYGDDGFGRHHAIDDAPIPSFRVVFGSLSKSSTEGTDPPRGASFSDGGERGRGVEEKWPISSRGRRSPPSTAKTPPRLTAPPSFDDDDDDYDDCDPSTADRLHPSMGTLERYDGELYRKLMDARPAVAAPIAPLPRPLVPDDDAAAGGRLAVVRCRPSATCDAYEIEDCVASRAYACRKFLAEVQFAFGGCSYLLPGLRGARGGSDDELEAARGGAGGGVSDWGGGINVSSFGSFVLGHTPGMRRSEKVSVEVWSPQSSETPFALTQSRVVSFVTVQTEQD